MAGAKLMEQGSKRREQILEYCGRFIDEHGYGPTVAEIADAVGLASKTAVRHHLQALIESNKIQLTPGRYRSLRVVGHG